MARKPIVAIVGRPNVGKSTLTNRLVGNRQSIVDDMPGVTRDRIYFDVEWQHKQFTVIDTGGIIPGDEDDIMVSIFNQAQIACDEADKIVFLVDGKEGINPIDYDIANILRKSSMVMSVFCFVLGLSVTFWPFSTYCANTIAGRFLQLLHNIMEDIIPSLCGIVRRADMRCAMHQEISAQHQVKDMRS